MKHRRIPGRRVAVAGAGIAALVVAGVTLQSANASETSQAAAPHTLSALAAGKLASTLGKSLGTDARPATFYDAKTKSLRSTCSTRARPTPSRRPAAKARIVENSSRS